MPKITIEDERKTLEEVLRKGGTDGRVIGVIQRILDRFESVEKRPDNFIIEHNMVSSSFERIPNKVIVYGKDGHIAARVNPMALVNEPLYIRSYEFPNMEPEDTDVFAYAKLKEFNQQRKESNQHRKA